MESESESQVVADLKVSGTFYMHYHSMFTRYVPGAKTTSENSISNLIRGKSVFGFQPTHSLYLRGRDLWQRVYRVKAFTWKTKFL